jgi:hypothetical protein
MAAALLLDVARETYGMARDEGQGRVSAGLAALRAATSKDRSAERGVEDVRERLAGIINKGRGEDRPPDDGKEEYNYARERLKGILDRDAEGVPQATSHKLDGHTELEQGVEPGPKPSIRERLDDVLNKPGEKLDLEDDRDPERGDKEEEVENARDRDRGEGHSL